MFSQKWNMLAFLLLFTFMVEVGSSSASVKDVIQQIRKTITALKNCNLNCSGKSPNKQTRGTRIFDGLGIKKC